MWSLCKAIEYFLYICTLVYEDVYSYIVYVVYLRVLLVLLPQLLIKFYNLSNKHAIDSEIPNGTRRFYYSTS